MLIECPHCHQQFEPGGDLPKEHKEAVGLAYYTALAATTPWDKVNNTGTVISLLMTSAEEAKDTEVMRRLGQLHMEWGMAMREYSEGTDSQQLHAVWRCQQVLGKMGGLAYRFGKMPTGGFKLTATGGQS